MSSGPRSPRLYRGLSIEERRAERRAALIKAAIVVYGRLGYRNASVKTVCDEAGLTERYFYESFAGSDALLAEAYRTVAQRTREECLAAARAAPAAGALRVVLHAYYERLRGHPEAARVFLVEIGGVSPQVDEAVREAMSSWMALLAPSAAADAPELVAAGVVGGLTQIALDWIASGYRRPVREVVDAALAICAAAGASRLPL
jgi:AcrR family transcriptional regulator